MKKIVFIMSALLIGMFVFTSCEGRNKKGSVKATEKTVLKYLPGEWSLVTEIDNEGESHEIEQSLVFWFGEEGVEVPEMEGSSSSSLAGRFILKEDSKIEVRNGRWNIEPSDEDPGVFAYLQDDKGELVCFPNEKKYFYIKTIGTKSMKIIFDEESSEGYIFKRIEKDADPGEDESEQE